MFLAIDLGQQLERAGFIGPQLKNVLQGLAGMRVGVIVDMLPGQAIPVVDLAFAAPVFNAALQRQRGGVVRLDLQRFLQLLESQRIFFLLKARAGGIKQLGKRFSPDRAVELAAQRANGVVHVAFGFEFAEDLPGKLEIAFFQGFGGALHAADECAPGRKIRWARCAALYSACRRNRARWRSDATIVLPSPCAARG